MEQMHFETALEWRLAWPLLVSAVLGAVVGLEREVHGRPAGLRTHILVCLGSALIIVAFQQVQASLVAASGEAIQLDPARAAAGIITGIGFLGAGTILKGKDHVMGLTTAASIWVVAAIGIATGLGLYFLAVASTLLVLFVLFVLHMVDIRSEHYGEILLTGTGGTGFYETTREQIAAMGFRIKGYQIDALNRDGGMKLRFLVKYRQANIGPQVLDALFRIEGVETVSWEK
jgi:putative Mg2+ transporter-C (MgtC) family protein